MEESSWPKKPGTYSALWNAEKDMGIIQAIGAIIAGRCPASIGMCSQISRLTSARTINGPGNFQESTGIDRAAHLCGIYKTLISF